MVKVVYFLIVDTRLDLALDPSVVEIVSLSILHSNEHSNWHLVNMADVHLGRCVLAVVDHVLFSVVKLLELAGFRKLAVVQDLLH